ncbi:MAG: hypothetical protein Q4B58_06655 [Bacteroidales bacterium]|nr:hypothetical protein [Bacteroidales bacterium]
MKKGCFILRSSIVSLLLSAMPMLKAQEESKLNVGVLVHTYVSVQQQGYGASAETSTSDNWDLGASVYRGRIMADMHITSKDYIFVETELTASVGLGEDKAASNFLIFSMIIHLLPG